jgi:hypothetical protein
MLRVCFVVAVVLGATSSASASTEADERKVGLRGLVQGNNQTPCTDNVACQWGKLGSVDVKRLYVDHVSCLPVDVNHSLPV